MIYRGENNITASSYMLCRVLSFLHALSKKNASGFAGGSDGKESACNA